VHNNTHHFSFIKRSDQNLAILDKSKQQMLSNHDHSDQKNDDEQLEYKEDSGLIMERDEPSIIRQNNQKFGMFLTYTTGLWLMIYSLTRWPSWELDRKITYLYIVISTLLICMRLCVSFLICNKNTRPSLGRIIISFGVLNAAICAIVFAVIHSSIHFTDPPNMGWKWDYVVPTNTTTLFRATLTLPSECTHPSLSFYATLPEDAPQAWQQFNTKIKGQNIWIDGSTLTAQPIIVQYLCSPIQCSPDLILKCPSLKIDHSFYDMDEKTKITSLKNHNTLQWSLFAVMLLCTTILPAIEILYMRKNRDRGGHLRRNNNIE
jgi:hypothetical protein